MSARHFGLRSQDDVRDNNEKGVRANLRSLRSLWRVASHPVNAMNSTLSRHARSIARELTSSCEYAINTALSNMAGACADASTSSLR